MASVNVGTGTTLTFAGFSSELKSISWSGIAIDMLETSHLGTASGTLGSKTFIGATLSDPGSIDVTFHFDPTEPPVMTSGALIAITIDFAGLGTGNIWSAVATMSDYSIDVTTEEIIEASCTFKLSGVITIA